MVSRKIFVIGCNKTGTTSIHELFIKQGLKSQHGLEWKLEEYQCFSDGIYNVTHNDVYKKCHSLFQDGLFVLNTRPMYNWIISRANHCSIFKNSKMKGWPPNHKTYLDWINYRISYYDNILDYFKNSPDQLILCNIEKPFWENFIMSFINNEQIIKPSLYNKTKIKESDIIKQEVEKAFDLSHIDKNSLLSNNKSTNLYKQHL